MSLSDLAQILRVDEATRLAAEGVVSGFLNTGNRYVPHCALLAASRLPPRERPLSLKDVWATEAEIDVNAFFATMEGVLEESGERLQTVRAELKEIFLRFEFLWTFYRKFEQIWQLLSSPCPVQQRYIWLLFLVCFSRHESLNRVKAALLLSGAVSLFSVEASTLSLLSDSLRLTEDEVRKSHQSMAATVQQLVERAVLKTDVQESVAGLERELDSLVTANGVDAREFLVPGKIKVTNERRAQYLNSPNPYLTTPISQAAECRRWISDVSKASGNLLAKITAFFASAERRCDIAQRVESYRNAVGGLSHFESDLVHTAMSVYLWEIANMIDRTKSLADFFDAVSHEQFHRGLLAGAVECVLFAYSRSDISLENVLAALGTSAFSFWKVVVRCYLRDSLLPRPLKSHFRCIEDKVVTSLGWERNGPVHRFVAALDDQPSDDEGEKAPAQVPYESFFRVVAKFAARRVVALGEKLGLEDAIIDKIWTALRHFMSEETEVLIGRHLDQIILCVFYGVCAAQKTMTWSDIMNCYSDLNPSDFSFVSRSVRTTSSFLTIEKFYGQLIAPRLRDFKFSRSREPRIKALSPAEGARAFKYMEEPDLGVEEQQVEKISLAQAKKERQEAEQQAQLLSNRIALLKQEEAKALKKVEDTRQRAREIMEARIRNQEKERKREEERKAREREEELKLESNRLWKEESRQSKENHKALVMQKLKDEVEAVKREKARNLEVIELKKTEVLESNVSRAQRLKDIAQAAKLKREEEAEERRRAAKLEVERRVQEELRIKHEKDAEVARMEQEELELIHRLQNTQMMHKTAIEELEVLMTSNGESGTRSQTDGSARATPSKAVRSKPPTPSKS